MNYTPVPIYACTSSNLYTTHEDGELHDNLLLQHRGICTFKVCQGVLLYSHQKKKPNAATAMMWMTMIAMEAFFVWEGKMPDVTQAVGFK